LSYGPVEPHIFTATAPPDIRFCGAEPRTESHSSTG